MTITYLTAADLYSINEQVLGERPFVRDRHMLLYAARRPSIELFGEEQFLTLYEKAAALLHSLAYHHLFADGNKRTAALAVMRFMRENGREIALDTQEDIAYILEIAQGKTEIPAIAEWIEQHTR